MANIKMTTNSHNNTGSPSQPVATVVLWRDVPGKPGWADELLHRVDDLKDSTDGCYGLIDGYPLKHGRSPLVSCRVRKGTLEQAAVHQFLDNLCEFLGRTP